MCYVPLVLRETELYLTTKQSNDIHSLQMATPNNIHTSKIHNSCVYECLYDHLILELQRCCWKMMLLSLHPNTIVHVEDVVSLFSSPSTSSQKVRKCGGHKTLVWPVGVFFIT